jgi:hypothetical protein
MPINEDPKWIAEHVASLPGGDELSDEALRLVVEKLTLLAMDLNAAVDAWNQLPHDVWD